LNLLLEKGHRWGRLVAITASVFVSLILISIISGNASAQDKTVVTIHEGETKKTFLTNASTVGDVLTRAEVIVGDGDLVEPALDEEVSGSSFTINVYRSHIVTVVDGVNEITISTAYRSPEAIADAAGLTVYPEDKFSFERAENFLLEGVGSRLVIDRAVPVELVLYGAIANVRTQAEYVAGFIEEKGIVLGEGEVVEPGLDAKVTKDMRLVIAKVGTEVIAVNEVVAYGREVINDPNAPVGSERVKTPGVEGEALVTYELTLRDGVESGRVKLQEVVLSEPKVEVVIIGSKEVDISGDKLDWMQQAGIPQSDWPYVDSIITKESQWRHQVWNTLGSGAYGLCQALPATKMASAGDDYMTNPVTQLKWCSEYAQVRYYLYSSIYILVLPRYEANQLRQT
jgi:uncharacterized protein YabE (DUF348 family)